MDYAIVIYVTDQIIGHSKALEVEDCPSERHGGITAKYPSNEKKPCDVRIWEMRDPSYFLVMWGAETKKNNDIFSANNLPISEKERERIFNEDDDEEDERRGQIAVHSENLEGALYRRFRKTRRRCDKRRKAEERWLKFQNMIIVSQPISKDEIRLQVGCYLIKDGILNQDAKWKTYALFQEYCKRHFRAWKKIEDTTEDIKIFENLCNNFKIPVREESFKNYLGVTIYGVDKKLFSRNKVAALPEIRDAREYEKQSFIETVPDPKSPRKSPVKKKEGKYRAANQAKINFKDELGSNFYARRYSGKMSLVMEKGRHIIPPDQEDELTKLVKEKRERKALREIVKYIEEETGIKYKSIMRYVQRLRKQGVHDTQDIFKYLGKYVPGKIEEASKKRSNY